MDLAYYVAKSSSNLTFTLFAAFPSAADCYTFEVLKKLAEQGQKFKFIPYFSQAEGELQQYRRRFDKDHISSAVDVNKISRFYIRGPDTFESAVQKVLKELGVADKAIYML